MPFQYFKEELRRHQLRRTPGNDAFAYAESIDFLVAGHWDLASQSAGVFFRRSYLQTLETHPPEGVQFRYALIYREARPIAAVVIQVLRADLSRLVPASSPLAAGGRLIQQKLVVCGSLHCWGNQGVAFAPGIDPASVWPSVAEVLYGMRRADKLHGETDFVLFRELPAGDASAQCLKDYGYQPVDIEPDMLLDLKNWTCWDDYLNSLQSKYRRSAKAILSKTEKAGCQLLKLGDLEPHRANIEQLYRAVWANADVRPVTLSPNYLIALNSALGEDYAFLALFQGERMIGYVTALRSDQVCVGFVIGFDRQAAEGVPIYLRLLYAVVEQALTWKCTSISFGGSALEPKAALGCHAQPAQVWVRHRIAPLNALIGPLLGSFSPQQPPERNPFKQA